MTMSAKVLFENMAAERLDDNLEKKGKAKFYEDKLLEMLSEKLTDKDYLEVESLITNYEGERSIGAYRLGFEDGVTFRKDN